MFQLPSPDRTRSANRPVAPREHWRAANNLFDVFALAHAHQRGLLFPARTGQIEYRFARPRQAEPQRIANRFRQTARDLALARANRWQFATDAETRARPPELLTYASPSC